MAPDPWLMVSGPAGELAVHLAGAPGPARRRALVVPGLPTEAGAAPRTGATFPALADHLAATVGWQVGAGCLRGVGRSPGVFSVRGWQEDLATLVGWLGGPVWLVGFGLAGTLALCLAASEPAVVGVAALGAPADLGPWLADPEEALARARRLGVVPAGSPLDPTAWAAEGLGIDPLAAVARLSSRPVLLVHGQDDEVVPVQHARDLAAAGGEAVELRVLAGAGHRLRADPRVVALLIGWLERQGA